jgi:SNF2 family DNA or RNA helicase
MLRRTKDDELNGEPLLILPARNVDIVECEFDEGERAFYEALQEKMEGAVQKMMGQEGGGGRKYACMLLMLLRLRQGEWPLGVREGRIF